MNPFQPSQRLSRLRQSQASRSLVQETHLLTQQLIAPLFINARIKEKQSIASMPGHHQWSLNDLPQEIDALSKLGIKAVILFGIPKQKDANGDSALREDGVIQQAIPVIRKANPDMLIITDLCFCQYTDHGHCGLLKGETIHQAATLERLQLQAISHAKAGADWVAPSGMVDGMVSAIRTGLDQAEFGHVPILSYSAKYASCLYKPFRGAADGAPQFGDRKQYQMDPANAEEAIRESAQDVEEGADILMVKPAGFYLDVIYRLKQQFPHVPLCAYQVGGEYAMIKAAASQDFLDEEQTIIESLLAIKRSGADMIITYFAKQWASILSKK